MYFLKPVHIYSKLPQIITPNTHVWTFRNFLRSASHRNYGTSKYKGRNPVYLLDPTIAGEVAKYVCDHTSPDAYIFEAAPGPGILSRALLQAGAQHLRVFERDEDFLPKLNILASSYSGPLEIICEDIMMLPKFEAKDQYDETRNVDFLFKGVTKRLWKEESPLSFVGVATDRRCINFMRFLLAKISLMTSLFAFGRCQFFFIITEKEYKYITATPSVNLDKYRASSMLYNIFFDINFIRKIPGFSLSSSHLLSKKKQEDWDKRTLHFAHFVPKANMFEHIASADKLPDLYYFIRHHMIKRTDNVIQLMEKWVPSCGPRLIFDGVKVFTRFGDLSPPEMVRLFQLFSSWPEYEESNFRYAVQQYFNDYMSEENFE